MAMLTNLLANQNTAVVGIVLVVVSFNTILTVAKKILDRYAPTSKADSILGTILKYSAKAVEFLSANSTVLPKEAQAEIAAQAQK